MSHPVPRELLHRVLRFSLRRSLPVSVNLTFRLPSSMSQRPSNSRIYAPISVRRNFNAVFNVVRLLRSVTRKSYAQTAHENSSCSFFVERTMRQCEPWNETCSDSWDLDCTFVKILTPISTGCRPSAPGCTYALWHLQLFSNKERELKQSSQLIRDTSLVGDSATKA